MAPKTAESFGDRLRALRARAELSTRALADRAGISFQQISRLETGRDQPLAATVVTLARALGCTPHDLLGWGG